MYVYLKNFLTVDNQKNHLKPTCSLIFNDLLLINAEESVFKKNKQQQQLHVTPIFAMLK